jgi:hypothetical protein
MTARIPASVVHVCPTEKQRVVRTIIKVWDQVAHEHTSTYSSDNTANCRDTLFPTMRCLPSPMRQ